MLRGPEIIKLIKTETEWGLVCTFERGCECQRGATAEVHAGDMPTQQRSVVRRAPVSTLGGAAAGEVGVAGFGLPVPRSEGLTLRGVGVPKGGSGRPGS